MEIDKLLLSNDPKDLILSFYENISYTLRESELIKKEVLKNIDHPSLPFAYRIIYASVITESIDDHLFNIGIDYLNSTLKTVSAEAENSFFESFNKLSEETKIFSLTVICSNSLLYNCDRTFLQKLFDAAQILNKPSINVSDQTMFFKSMRYILYQKEENFIKQAVLKSINSGNVDFKIILQTQFNNINSFNICDTLVTLAGQSQDPSGLCIKFLAALKEIPTNLCYQSILEALFYIPGISLNYTTISYIVRSYVQCLESPFPLEFIYRFKAHKNIIIHFVRLACESPEVLSFTRGKFTPVAMPLIYQKTEYNILPNNWGSIEFISLISYLHKHLHGEIFAILKATIPNFVDYAFVGMLQQKHFTMGNLMKKIFQEFILYYISSEKSSMEILKYVWNFQKCNEEIRKCVVQGFLEYFIQNTHDLKSRICRILDVAQNLKAVAQLLNSDNLGFVIEIAVIAKKREYVQLDKWLNEKLQKYRENLISAILGYIRKNFNVLITNDTNNDKYTVRENSDALDDILSFLLKHKLLLNNDEAVKLIDHICFNYRQIIEACNMQKPADDKEKMEKAANCFTFILQCTNSQSSYDEKIIQLDEFLKEIAKRNNDGSRSEALFYVIEAVTNSGYYKYLTNLDLNSIACLIGRMLEVGLLDPIKVLDLIDTLLSNHTVYSRYFFMSISIFACCLFVLNSAVDYATKWLRSSYFAQLPPFLRFCIEYVHYKHVAPLTDNYTMLFLDPYEIASKNSNFITDMLRRVESDNHFLNTKNELLIYQPNNNTIDNSYKTDLSDSIIQPQVNIKKIVSRIFNNLCEENLKESASELKRYLGQEDYDWLAHEMVHELICNQLNLHYVYFKLLKEFDNNDLYFKIRTETNSTISYLLSEIKEDSQNVDRNHLYTLGSWFGLITVGDNKPLLYKEINIKMLLVEAGFKGQDDISRILPFVKNFMASVRSHPIFTSSNPWVLGITSVLAEIYQRTDLRPTLRFEIETVVRSYGINMKTIYPSVYLTIPETISRIKLYLPWTEEEINCFTFKLTINSEKYLSYEKLDVINLNSILDYLNLSVCPEEFHKCIGEAFMAAIREISMWIMDRVGKAVGNLVETVVQQDFSKDPDENHVIYAAHTMSKSISVGYAGVLLKGTFFTEICGRLKNGVDSAIRKELEIMRKNYEKEKLNKIVYHACQENIEALCCFITKSCAERIIQGVDKKLHNEYETRKIAHLEKQLFVSSCPGVALDSLPDRLRSKVGIPTVSQLSVYHEFNKLIPGFAHETNQLLEKQIIFNDTSDKMFLQDISESNKKIVYSILYQYCKRLQSIVTSTPPPSVDPVDPSKFQSIVKIQESIVQIVVTNDVKLLPALIHDIVSCYFELINKFKSNQEDFHVLVVSDTLIDILQCLRDTNIFTKYLCNLVTKSVTDFASDIRNFTFAMIKLISSRLLLLKNYDQRISYEVITNSGSISIEFATDICRSMLVEESYRGLVTEFDFSNILDTLTHISTIQSGNDNGETSSLDPTINGSCGKKIEEPQKNYQAETVLREWVRMYYTKSEVDIDTNFKIYMILLAQCGVLRNDAMLLTFFKTCFDIVVDLSFQVTEMQAIVRAYQIIDSYACLLVLTIKYYGGDDATSNSLKMNLFNKILNIIASSFAHDNNFRPKLFRPLVYLRMFVSIILEISRPDNLIEGIRKNFVTCFLGCLHSINPEIFPSFTHSFLMIAADRHLIPLILEENSSKNQIYYKQILIDIMRFIYPFLIVDHPTTPPAVNSIYEALIRLMLVLSHDFPSFISTFYLDFMLHIPHQCLQLRNIILSVIPRGCPTTMDYTQPTSSPSVNFNPLIYLPESFIKNTETFMSKSTVDNYSLIFKPYINETNLDIKFKNICLITSFVFYIGTTAINYLMKNNKNIHVDVIKSTVQYSMLAQLCQNLEPENQYLLLTAIANNIRFLSTHTKYYSCILQLLYININDSRFKERLSRVLVERVMCCSPYPIGIVSLLHLFIKNSEFKFLKQKCFVSNEGLVDKVIKNLNLGKTTK